jgi:murein DD-endopeptidase MepM/ murein hydrolase activator NlpD
MHPPIKHLDLRYAPKGDTTQFFGENPALYARFGLIGHNGIDLVRPHGEPLYAIEDGTVISTKEEPDGFGKNIRIISDAKDKEGNYRVWTYGHNHENYVKVGDKVKAGQHVAAMGNTGFVVSSSNANGFWKTNPYAGTHVHLGLRLVKRPRRGGWSYEGSDIKIDVVDYDNGYKGSINPKPYLDSLQSTAPEQNKSLFRQLLKIKDLISKLK